MEQHGFGRPIVIVQPQRALVTAARFAQNIALWEEKQVEAGNTGEGGAVDMRFGPQEVDRHLLFSTVDKTGRVLFATDFTAIEAHRYISRTDADVTWFNGTNHYSVLPQKGP